MSQRNRLLDLFNIYGGKLTLGQIMKTDLAAEYRAQISELRNEGHRIECIKGPTPSENVYRLTHWDKRGQGELL